MRAKRREFASAPPRPRRRVIGRRSLLCNGLGLAALAAAIIWAATSERFVVKEVIVRGAVLSDRPQVEQVLTNSLTGRNLWLLNAQGLNRQLRSLPTVASVAVERRSPHSLLLLIREREPVALVQAAGQRWLIDVEGMVLAPATEGDGYPLLSCASLPERRVRPGDRLPPGQVRQALITAARARALNLWPLQGVEVDEQGGITCVSQEGVQIRCGPPTRLDTKLRLACAVLASQRGQSLAVVDVADPANPFSRKGAPAP